MPSPDPDSSISRPGTGYKLPEAEQPSILRTDSSSFADTEPDRSNEEGELPTKLVIPHPGIESEECSKLPCSHPSLDIEASTTIARKGFAGLYFLSIDGLAEAGELRGSLDAFTGRGMGIIVLPSLPGWASNGVASGGMNSRRVLKLIC